MSSHETVDFEAIGARVMHELHRRLATPELAQDLPGTLLMKVAMDYVKHLERRNELEEAKLAQEKIDPLEMIDQEGLPMTLRLQVLAEYLDEIEEVWRAASTRMSELTKEVTDGDDDVLPELQDVVPEV